MFTAFVWLSGFLIGVSICMISMRMKANDLKTMIEDNKKLNMHLKSRIEKNEKELAKMTLSYAMTMSRKSSKPKSAKERTPIEDIEA